MSQVETIVLWCDAMQLGAERALSEQYGGANQKIALVIVTATKSTI
jgi:hypothetical protein